MVGWQNITSCLAPSRPGESGNSANLGETGGIADGFVCPGRFPACPAPTQFGLNQHLQKLPGDLLGVRADFAGGADAGGAAVAAAAVTD